MTTVPARPIDASPGPLPAYLHCCSACSWWKATGRGADFGECETLADITPEWFGCSLWTAR